MKAEHLILFTNGFPCVKEGEEFLEKELELLSTQFKSITIYVLVKAEVCRAIPSNVKVKYLEPTTTKKVRTLVLRNFPVISRIILNDLKDAQARKGFLKNYKFYSNVLIGNIILKEAIEKELKEQNLEIAKLYSYWCGPWFDVLMLLDKKVTDAIIFRAHGYDFDVNQRTDKYIPYRNYLIKKNPFISFISQFGYNTYETRYPDFKNKRMYRLGVTEQKENPMISKGDGERVIVSCSSLIPLKRVHLIVDVLKFTKAKIKWVHFGHGPLLEEVKLKAVGLNKNISVEFKGQVAHSEVINYYKNNPVDLFMNVSELEGIPVSIMEAISFGIPVTGCNICGVPEIVTKETGFLWDVNFKADIAAKQIDTYFALADDQIQNLRASTRNYWKKHFNAEINYNAFIKNCLLN